MEKANYTIFLADDDEDDRYIFTDALEEINPKISYKTFENGIDLMHVLSNPKNKLPDYIFLDLNMPLMDGEECLQKIRNLDYLNDIPVIIQSTSIDASKAERLRDLGANLYLKKPNTFSALKTAILNCLEDVKMSFDTKNERVFIVQL